MAHERITVVLGAVNFGPLATLCLGGKGLPCKICKGSKELRCKNNKPIAFFGMAKIIFGQ